MGADFEKRALIFKALCDEKRLRIIELLKEKERCVCCLCELTEMPQSTLSYHMRILCESGIVVAREEGKWTHYRLSKEGSRAASAALEDILGVGEGE